MLREAATAYFNPRGISPPPLSRSLALPAAVVAVVVVVAAGAAGASKAGYMCTHDSAPLKPSVLLSFLRGRREEEASASSTHFLVHSFGVCAESHNMY